MQAEASSVHLNEPLNVTTIIDEQPITARQMMIFGLCALVNFLDGTDNLALAATARSIADSLGTPVSSFGIVFTISNIGAVVGAVLFGFFADQHGRKTALLTAVLLLSALTLATPFAPGIRSLFAIRFIAGFGIGGALPCLMSLAAEYAPKRRRKAIIPVVFAGQSVGLMLGGYLNAFVLGSYGWHFVYYVDATIGLAVFVLTALLMPESLRFLIGRGRTDARAKSILNKIAPKVEIAGRSLMVSIETEVKVSVKELFRGNLARQTVMLWAAFILSFAALAAMTQWVPALLTLNGINAGAAAKTVSFGGAGAILGLLSGSLFTDKVNASWLMSLSLIIAAVCIFALGYELQSVVAAEIFVLLATAFISVALAGLFAMSATAYPAKVRATGVGFAVASTRCGNIGGLAIAAAMLGAGVSGTGIMIAIASASALAAISVVLLEFAIRRNRTQLLAA